MKNHKQKSGPSEVTFARDLGLFDATMLGSGAMIGAGIFVLTGIAADEAGPASILAFSLNGFVTLLTAFAYAELPSAIPRSRRGVFIRAYGLSGRSGLRSGLDALVCLHRCLQPVCAGLRELFPGIFGQVHARAHRSSCQPIRGAQCPSRGHPAGGRRLRIAECARIRGHRKG